MEEIGIVKYSIVEAEIAKWKEIYMDLAIDDLESKEQFDAIHSARMVVKNGRIAIEKERKNLNSDALAWQKKVNGRAKELFALIEPIETHLQNEEQKVIDEQNRIEAEEEARQKAIVEKRIEDLLKVECPMSFVDVAVLTDEEFDNLLMGKTLEFEERQKLKAIAEAEQRAEAERLELQRKEQEEKDKKLKADQEALEKAEAVRERFMKPIGLFRCGYDKNIICGPDGFVFPDAFPDTWKSLMELTDDDFDHWLDNIEIQIEKYRKMLADKQEQEAKAKAEREAKEAEEKRIAAEKEAKRQEALKPDKQKISEWLMNIEIQWLDKYPADVSEEMEQFVFVVRNELSAQIVGYRKELDKF